MYKHNVVSALVAALRQRMRHRLERRGFPPFLPFPLSSLFASVTFYHLFLFFFLPIPPPPSSPILSLPLL